MVAVAVVVAVMILAVWMRDRGEMMLLGGGTLEGEEAAIQFAGRNVHPPCSPRLRWATATAALPRAAAGTGRGRRPLRAALGPFAVGPAAAAGPGGGRAAGGHLVGGHGRAEPAAGHGARGLPPGLGPRRPARPPRPLHPRGPRPLPRAPRAAGPPPRPPPRRPCLRGPRAKGPPALRRRPSPATALHRSGRCTDAIQLVCHTKEEGKKGGTQFKQHCCHTKVEKHCCRTKVERHCCRIRVEKHCCRTRIEQHCCRTRVEKHCCRSQSELAAKPAPRAA